MRLIKPSYKIITKIDGEQILAEIERVARMCYESEGEIDFSEEIYGKEVYDKNWEIRGYHIRIAKSARILIGKLIANGHHAMLEFGGMITVKFICDRGVSHELVDTPTQESTMYCNSNKNKHISFIIPCWTNIQEAEYPANCTLTVDNTTSPEQLWFHTMRYAENSYLNLLKDGWSHQQARSVLPSSLKTEINVSKNIKEWRDILQQRTAKTEHQQMRELMCPLLDEFKKHIPVLFDDIKY